MFFWKRPKIKLGINISGASIEVYRLAAWRTPHDTYGRILAGMPLFAPNHFISPDDFHDLIRTVCRETVEEYDTAIQAIDRKSMVHAVLSIAEARALVAHRRFSAPMEEVNDELVINEMRRVVPEKIENLYWDYRAADRGGTGTHVLFVAYRKRIVDAILRACKAAHIVIDAAEHEAAAIGRALFPRDARGTGTVMVLDMGVARTNIIVFADGEEVASMTAFFGGHDISRYVAQTHGLSNEDAELYKREYGVFESATPESEIITPLVRGIEKTREHIRRVTGRDADMIVLIGGASLTPGIADFLSGTVGLPVSPPPAWSEEGSPELFALYTHAYGSALRDEGEDGIDILRRTKH